MYPYFFSFLLLFFALISWREPKHGLWLLAFGLPAYLLRFDILGIPFTFLEAMILILTAITLLKQPHLFLTAWNTLPLPWKILIAGTLAVATVALLPAPDIFAALGVWKAYFIEPIFVFFLVRILLQNKKDLSPLLIALGGGALFVALFAIVQWMFQIGIPVPWDIERRVTSLFPYPNAVGLYLGPLMIMSVLAGRHTWQSHHKKLFTFWMITVVLSGTAIVLAQSEAAILAVTVTIFVLSLLSRFWRKITLPLAAIVILLIALIPSTRTFTFQKLALQDYSGSIRLTQWEETFHLLKDHSLVGAGLAGYPTALIPYHTHDYIEIFQYPHNLLLNAWVELGILGVILSGYLVYLLVRSVPRIRHSWINLLGLTVFFEMLIHGLVDVPYFKNDLSVLVWIFLALLLFSYDSRSPDSSSPKKS